MKLTLKQIDAIRYIGRQRKTGAKREPKLSRYMINKLINLGLVIEVDDIVVLTTEGEHILSALYPTRKHTKA